MSAGQHSRNRQRLCRPVRRGGRNGFAFPIRPLSLEGYAFRARLEAQPLKNKGTGSERQSHSAQVAAATGGAAGEKWCPKNNILADRHAGQHYREPFGTPH
jgi:hypothetical protein